MDDETERALADAGYLTTGDYVKKQADKKAKPGKAATRSGGNGPRPKEK